MQQQRDLLFALLALQNDFIKQEQLLKAFGAWLADKSNSLITILVEQRAISSDDVSVFDRLVDKHLERFGGDATQSLANISGIDSLGEELKQLAEGDSDALLTVSYLPSTSRSSAGTASYATHAGDKRDSGIKVHAGSSENRFRIVKEHAKGGLGVVFVAEDQHLKREVALKQIRQDRADIDVYRQKFLQEAEVTGQLEHPGIVPVYALGSDNHGRPYYAMRFIKGEDLQSRIRQFHAEVKSGKCNFDGPELRGLLRRFIDVCNAIDYAHDRGVLHRDLKPGNVMLGKYGETLVVDWGLAKPLRKSLQADVEQQVVQSELPVCRENEDHPETQEGAFLGTATYAPPEQLKGELGRLCPASDVYSLGAILYELLCGRYLVVGRSLNDVIQVIESHAIARPTTCVASIPRPLESICLKSLSPRIEDRYRSASDLRDEIEAWLNDAPVSAHRDSMIQRVARWARRHRILVAASVSFVAVGTLALAGITVLQQIANRQITQQRDKAQWLSAKTLLDKGVQLAMDGSVSDGMLHMSAALETLPDGRPESEKVIRQNISAWSANAQSAVGKIDLEGTASQSLEISSNGKYVATVLGDSTGHRNLVVLECLPVLRILHKSQLQDDVAALAFSASGRLFVSSNKSLLDFSISDGDTSLIAELPNTATSLKVGSTGRIWAGCDTGEIGWIEPQEPKWNKLANCQSYVLTLDVSQREERIIACAIQNGIAKAFIYNAEGAETVAPFTAGIGNSYAIDADHGIIAASFGSSADASNIGFWRCNGQRIGANIKTRNSANDLEFDVRNSLLLTTCKDLRVDTQSLLDWRVTRTLRTPLAAIACQLSDDSKTMICSSVGRLGTQLSASIIPEMDSRIVELSEATPMSALDLGDVSLWGGNGNSLDVLDNKSWKVVATIAIGHPASQIYEVANELVIAGGNRLSVIGSDGRVIRKSEELPFNFNPRGIIVSRHAKDVALISNAFGLRDLQSIAIESLKASQGPDTNGWFCYGFANVPMHELLLLGLHDGRVVALDRNSKQVNESKLLTDAEIFDLAVNPDQTKVVAVTRLGSLFTYSLPGLQFIAKVDAADGKYPSVKFSPDGEFLISGFSKTQLRDAESMLPIGLFRGCPTGKYGQKADCFVLGGYATASQLSSGMGYVEWTPIYPESSINKDDAFEVLSRKLGSSRHLDGTEVKDKTPLSSSELENSFPKAGLPLPTSESFSRWQTLRDRFGRLDFESPNPQTQNSLAPLEDVSQDSPVKALQEVKGANGHQLAVLDGNSPFMMGSPLHELGRLPNETYHERSVRLMRFAIGTSEVTLQQYANFQNRKSDHNMEPSGLPAGELSWYDAAAYCNWLSELDGLDKNQCCYLPNDRGEYAPGMELPSDWWNRTGYRLPTESEWEFACRAGTKTSRPCGDTLESIDEWCWTSRNAQGVLHEVRQKQPNRFGLYDMLGNVSEWCHTSHEFLLHPLTGEPSMISEFPGPVHNHRPRSVRGGSALEFHGNARSAFRDYYTPDTKLPCLGFRVCRTITAQHDRKETTSSKHSQASYSSGEAGAPAVEKLDAEVLQPFVGQYSYRSAILQITAEDGQLFAQLTDQPKFPLFPKGKDTFEWRVVKAQVEFVRDDQGVVTLARHSQEGTTFDAPKLK